MFVVVQHGYQQNLLECWTFAPDALVARPCSSALRALQKVRPVKQRTLPSVRVLQRDIPYQHFLCELSEYFYQSWFASVVFSGPLKRYSMKCYERGSQILEDGAEM